MREVAVGRAVAVAVAIAVDEHVVVPLQIVRLDLVDQRASGDPSAIAAPRRWRGRSARSDPSRTGRLRVASHDSSTPGAPTQREVDALGLDPQAELHARGCARTRAAARGRRGTAPDPRVQSPRPASKSNGPAAPAPGYQPASIDEQLDAERRGAIHLRAHRRLVDLGAVGEPGVVGDERRRTAGRRGRRRARTRAAPPCLARGRRARRRRARAARRPRSAIVVVIGARPTVTTVPALVLSNPADHAPDHISAA